MASRWPCRLPLAASISRSTSASVRCSRVRRSAFGRRRGITVRFTEAGVTSLRCDFGIGFRRLCMRLSVKWLFCERFSMQDHLDGPLADPWETKKLTI